MKIYIPVWASTELPLPNVDRKMRKPLSVTPLFLKAAHQSRP